MRKWVASFILLLVSAGTSPAIISLFLNDDCDDATMVRQVFDDKDVARFRQKIDDFRKKLYPLKERDFIALFGKSQPKPPKTYAMPVGEYRGLSLSGIRYADPKLNKDHTEFYIIKDVAALEVYYHIDGESPAAFVFHFPVDKDFPKLTKDNLAHRLSWDEQRWKKFLASFDKRMVEVFPWEIDQKELAKFQRGDFAANAKAKLEAWIESGKALGYKCVHEEGSDEWSWYRPDGTKTRSAFRGAKDGPPVQFFWHHEDGQSELRKECFAYRTGELTSRRWCRPGTTFNIRYESSGGWCWCDKDGKSIRVEWDENGDGIPDWYVTKEDNIAYWSDSKAKEKRKPLKVEDSWAIDPRLIPEESRIPDQPDLRLPIRRKRTAEPAKR